jgi:hypothetical protein
MSEPLSDPTLMALESALAGLAPWRAGMSRDRMLFRAGQVALRRRGRLWIWATAALAVLCATLGAALLLHSGPRTVERVVFVRVAELSPAPADPKTAPEPVREEVPAAAAVAAEELPPNLAYLRLRQQVVEHGADALPPVATWSAPAEAASLENLLGMPPGALAAPRLPRANNVLPRRGAS